MSERSDTDDKMWIVNIAKSVLLAVLLKQVCSLIVDIIVRPSRIFEGAEVYIPFLVLSGCGAFVWNSLNKDCGEKERSKQIGAQIMLMASIHSVIQGLLSWAPIYHLANTAQPADHISAFSDLLTGDRFRSILQKTTVSIVITGLAALILWKIIRNAKLRHKNLLYGLSGLSVGWIVSFATSFANVGNYGVLLESYIGFGSLLILTLLVFKSFVKDLPESAQESVLIIASIGALISGFDKLTIALNDIVRMGSMEYGISNIGLNAVSIMGSLVIGMVVLGIGFYLLKKSKRPSWE